MAEKQASWIQASSHPADTDRLVLEGLLNPSGAPVSGAPYGVGTPAGDLLVTQNGSPNMSVNVAGGRAWIDGTESPTQGAYHVYNDAVKNLAISAAHATLARKDLIVARVQDAQYSGATNAWTLAVVTGTPAGSPAEPAVPANAIVLALVDVAALAASITNANITDRRRRASALGGIVVCTSTTRPAAPYTGQVIYETDTDRPAVWDGAAWKQLGLKYDPPTCRVFNSADQSIANNSGVIAAFNSERFDTDTMHDNVTNNSRITITTAGIYVVTFTGQFTVGSDYIYAYAGLRVSGATDIAYMENYPEQGGNTVDVRLSVTTVYKFTAGQYIEVLVAQRNGAAVARNLLSTGNYSPEFSATWIGRGN